MKKAYRDPSWLYQKYVIEEYSMMDIGHLCGVHGVTVFKWLHRLGIKPRSHHESLYTKRARLKMTGRFRDKGSKWKGGAYISQDGYLQRLVSSNPKKYYPSHRLLMENHLGRPLTNDEVVHHINGNKLDNRIENLAAMTNGEHVAIHNKTRLKALPEGGK